MALIADEFGLEFEFMNVVEALPVETDIRGLYIDNSASNVVGVAELMENATRNRFVDERRITPKALINAAPTAATYRKFNGEGRVDIAGGWDTNKASVIFCVSHSVPGMTIKTYVQGYTDELVLAGDELNPEMRIYFNKIFVVRELNDRGYIRADLGAIYNVVYDPDKDRAYLELDIDTSRHLCNPEYLKGAIDDIESLEEEFGNDLTISVGSIRSISTLHQAGYRSGANMLSSIIKSAAKHRYEDVEEYDYTPTTRSLEFFKALYLLKGEFSPIYVTVSELEELFGYNNVSNVTDIKLAKTDQIEFPYNCVLEDNNADTLEAQMNYTLNNELMKVFSELGVTQISMAVDNYDGVDKPYATLTDELDLRLVAEGIDDTAIVQTIINYIEDVIFPQISENLYTVAIKFQYTENIGFVAIRVEGVHDRPITYGFVNSAFIDSVYIDNVVSSDRMIKNALATDTLIRG